VTAAAQIQGVRIEAMLARAHPSWHPTLRQGLEALSRATPDYLPGLLADDFLPSGERLLAAFAQPLEAVHFVLFGEGPYPRDASATGVCFMDGAVGRLWARGGLSKQVNRATSLRNFMKMLLVADGRLDPAHTAGDAMVPIAVEAGAAGTATVQTLAQLQDNLHASGFLLLNASLVFRAQVAPLREARAWTPFLDVVLAALAARAAGAGQSLPTLVLWGKVAALVDALPSAVAFPKVIAEHPYNLSFITNHAMHALFQPLALLRSISREGL
jgi:uracil-DNA glycosylase